MEPTHGSETKRHQFIVTVGGLEGGRVYFEMNRDSAPENTKAGDTLELCVTNTGQEETESRALVLAETTVGFEVSIMRSGVLAKVQVGDELAVVITSIRPSEERSPRVHQVNITVVEIPPLLTTRSQ